jgi:ABC-type branched-subunit amino acid transport system ATPase component
VAHALGIADEVAVLVKGQVTYDGPVAEMGDLSERLLPSATSVEAPSPNGQ